MLCVDIDEVKDEVTARGVSLPHHHVSITCIEQSTCAGQRQGWASAYLLLSITRRKADSLSLFSLFSTQVAIQVVMEGVHGQFA